MLRTSSIAILDTIDVSPYKPMKLEGIMATFNNPTPAQSNQPGQFTDIDTQKPKRPWFLYGVCGVLVVGIVAFGAYVYATQQQTRQQNQTAQQVAQSQPAQTQPQVDDNKKDKNGAGDANGDSSKKELEVAYTQYEQALKNPQTHLAKKGGAAFKTYKYLMCDIDKNNIADVVLLGTDGNADNPSSYSAAVLMSGGYEDSFTHPKTTFNLEKGGKVEAYLSRNVKHETLLYTRKKDGVCQSELYAFFSNTLKKVSEKTYQDGDGAGDFEASQWQKLSWDDAYDVADLTPLSTIKQGK